MSVDAARVARRCPAWCAGTHAQWQVEGSDDGHARAVAESNSDASWGVTLTQPFERGWAQIEVDGEGRNMVVLSASEARGLAAALVRAADLIQHQA